MKMVSRRMLANPANVIFPLIVLTLAVYHSTVVSLLQLWTNPENPTYSHGLLLVVVCVVLFYRQWATHIETFQLQPNAPGTLLLGITSFVWLLASLGNIQIVRQLCLLVIVGFVLWSTLGYRAARTVSFPILLMFFAIPIWEPLTIYLQIITVNAVAFLLTVTGIPSVLEGIFVLVPAGTFEVTLSCSGLSQFIVAIMVAALYSHINRIGLRRGSLLTLIAIGVSILTNTLRIYIVVLAGQLTAMQHYFVTEDHWTLGWVLFGIGMLVFILVVNRVIPVDDKESTGKKPALHGMLDKQARPVTRIRLTALLIILCGIAIGPALTYHYRAWAADLPPPESLMLPDQIGPWRIDDAYVTTWHPQFQGPDLVAEKTYRNPDNERMALYLAYYNRQEQGKEAVYYSNSVYDRRNWRLVSEQIEKQVFANMTETRIKAQNGQEKLVWHWYYVSGVRTSSDYMAKILNVWGILKHDPSIAVFAMSTDVRQSYESSVERLHRFASEALPALERAVDAVEST